MYPVDATGAPCITNEQGEVLATSSFLEAHATVLDEARGGSEQVVRALGLAELVDFYPFWLLPPKKRTISGLHRMNPSTRSCIIGKT